MPKDTPKPKGKGRPSDYTPELAAEICAELALGKSMRTVCSGENMPAMSTVFVWLRLHKDFQEQYARAKQESADVLVEDILDISDDGTNDYMTIVKGDKEYEVVNGEAIQRSRLRVDSRKWIAAKLKPKKYGDKLDIDQTTEITHKFEELTDEELERAIKARQDKLS